MIRSACRSHQCPRFESFQPLLLLLLDTELTAIMTVRNPLLLHNRFILQLISARICARYIRIYLFAISVNVPSKYLRSILIESWGEGTRCIYSFRDSIRIWKDIRTSFTRLLTSRSVQRFSVIFSRTQTEKEGGRESAHGRMEQLLCTGRSFDLETGYTDTEASERASVYTRRRRWDTPTCRDISVSCIISFKAFNQCRGPAVI